MGNRRTGLPNRHTILGGYQGKEKWLNQYAPPNGSVAQDEPPHTSCRLLLAGDVSVPQGRRVTLLHVLDNCTYIRTLVGIAFSVVSSPRNQWQASEPPNWTALGNISGNLPRDQCLEIPILQLRPAGQGRRLVGRRHGTQLNPSTCRISYSRLIIEILRWRVTKAAVWDRLVKFAAMNVVIMPKWAEMAVGTWRK
ncbi:hypothetical protein MMC14_004808 [Varicellaria rhodocarpa]|nr:hypothetical protein [Varicellaria rhodocarpa]